MNKNMKEKCKNCEILESGSIIKVELNGDCIFCGRNLHTQFVPQKHMTYTEKRLEEYCKKFGLCKEKGTCQCKKELKFIADSIAQAIAEDRERVENMRNAPPPFPADKENPTKHVYQNQGYAKALDDVLKPLPGK